MKTLLILIVGLMLTSCGSKSGNSNGGSNGAPTVSIATDLVDITSTNLSSFEVRGTCSENGQPVTVSMGGVSATPNCTSLAWTTEIDLSSLTGASRVIAITADHASSGGKNATQATGGALLPPRVMVAADLVDITSTNLSSFEVRGTCSENGQPVTVSMGGVSATPNCTSLAWTTEIDLSSLTGASRSIAITANHATSGGLEAEEATVSTLLPPRVMVAADLVDITSTNLSSFEVRGTCSENGQPVTVSMGGVSATPNCTSLAWTTEIDLSSLTGASRSIAITANHATSGGLEAEEATVSTLLPPRVMVATDLVDITSTNLSSFEVRGTCSENGQPVTVSMGGVSATPNCTSLAWTTEIDLSSLTGASRSIAITANHATSGGLEAEEATGGALLPPRVMVATNLVDITSTNLSSFEVRGTCSENGQPVTVSMGGVSATPNCTSLAWTTEIDLSSLTGASRSIAITANHATSGGLEAEEATGSTLLHPRVSINADAVGITSANEATFSVSGTCSESGQPVTVGVDTVSATSTCATGGTWTAEVDMSGLTGDSRPIAITADHATSDDPPLEAIQAIGSVIAYLSFSMDDVADITAANAGSFTVSGSCLEEGRPIAVSVGTVSPGTNPDCTRGAWTITMDVTGLNRAGGNTSVTADHSPATGSAHTQQTQTVTNNFTCPTNYVGVPELSGYTTHSFCVMKYEAKSDGSDNAVAQATGTPYVRINRADSITKCTGLNGAGEDNYDLITNDEWQSLARNIELVPGNWATGSVGNAGGLSRGHSDNSPNNALAASSNDNEGCSGTEQTCSNTLWDSQRRTHALSNGEIIWDFAGNVSEWVKDNSRSRYGPPANISEVTATSHSASNSLSNGTTTTARNAKDQFGPSGDYTSLNASPYGGLGYGWLDSDRGGVYRSGYWNDGVLSGVFAVDLIASVGLRGASLGFRCVFHP